MGKFSMVWNGIVIAGTIFFLLRHVYIGLLQCWESHQNVYFVETNKKFYKSETQGIVPQVNFCIFKDIEISFDGFSCLKHNFFFLRASLSIFEGGIDLDNCEIQVILLDLRMSYRTCTCNKRPYIPDMLDQKQPKKL